MSWRLQLGALAASLLFACSESPISSSADGGGGLGGAAGFGGVAGSAGTSGAAGATTDAGFGGVDSGADAAVDREDVRAWVKEVTLGPEFGGGGQICSRWVSSPTLSVMQGDETVRQDLLDLVPTLNQLMSPSGVQLSLAGDGDPNADILVYYAPVTSFDSIAQSHGFPYVPGNDGYFYTFWNGKHEIQRGYVLLATDKLSGNKLRHFTFEEVTQVLGLSNDSAYFSDSIFFADGAAGGNATELSALDEQLVTFFYSHVAPGALEADVDAAFDAYFP